jgi:hypothetical protein
MAPTSKVKATPPKLTDAERHARFKEMAREVEASDKPEDFERAFGKVIERPKSDSTQGSD